MSTNTLRRSALLQFAKFLAVGALNTLFGYGVFAGLIWLAVPPVIALVITYVVGVLFNFATTGHFVFDHRELSALVRFIGAYVVVFLLNLALYQALSTAGAAPLVAQGICVPIVAVVSFFIFKFHVFKPRPSSPGSVRQRP